MAWHLDSFHVAIVVSETVFPEHSFLLRGRSFQVSHMESSIEHAFLCILKNWLFYSAVELLTQDIKIHLNKAAGSKFQAFWTICWPLYFSAIAFAFFAYISTFWIWSDLCLCLPQLLLGIRKIFISSFLFSFEDKILEKRQNTLQCRKQPHAFIEEECGRGPGQ